MHFENQDQENYLNNFFLFVNFSFWKRNIFLCFQIKLSSKGITAAHPLYCTTVGLYVYHITHQHLHHIASSQHPVTARTGRRSSKDKASRRLISTLREKIIAKGPWCNLFFDKCIIDCRVQLELFGTLHSFQPNYNMANALAIPSCNTFCFLWCKFSHLHTGQISTPNTLSPYFMEPHHITSCDNLN